jgi:intracellular septation protein A
LIIAVGLVMIVAGGLLITASGADQSRYWKWKDMIIKVAIGIALLGLSGVILHMINPNFFK